MKKELLDEIVSKIIKDGIPLFNRDSIEKMLRRMYKETAETLECCANCIRFRRDKNGLHCLDKWIHRDLIQPWNVCGEHWEYDNTSLKKRKGL